MTRRLALLTPLLAPTLPAAEPLRLGVAGLVHGHVAGFFRLALERSDVRIVGIAEANDSLAERSAKTFRYDPALRHASLEQMLDSAKPEAVVAYTNTFDHRRVVELCAARGIHVMMEKPLAISIEHGEAIAAAGRRAKIHVLVNYETTWYPNNQTVWSVVKERKALGGIRKVVVRDGHQGPRGIKVQPEFFEWLTDPQKNGAGALYDFGCYGANLMTWLMDGARPLSVTAVTQRLQPDAYPNVDDDATVVLAYPSAQAVLQASWNWPYARKDMDIYGESGSVQTIRGEAARVRIGKGAEEEVTAPPYPAPFDSALSYFGAVVRGRIAPSGLSSLENNLVVTEILDAARRSAASGTTIRLGGR
jgi:predicted dehydrogenase